MAVIPEIMSRWTVCETKTPLSVNDDAAIALAVALPPSCLVIRMMPPAASEYSATSITEKAQVGERIRNSQESGKKVCTLNPASKGVPDHEKVFQTGSRPLSSIFAAR